MNDEMLSAVSQYKNTPLYCPQVLSSITTTLAPNNMPDPRLLTIEENDYSGVDTTADAWHIPPSYFEVPKSPVQEVPSSPSSPYECHSPLAHELEDHSRADSSAPAHLKCDISCTGSSTCRHRSSVSEHPFHRRRKSALPQGVWTSIADIKEMAVDANIANPPSPSSPFNTTALSARPSDSAELVPYPTTSPGTETDTTTAAAYALATDRRAAWAEAIAMADPQGTALMYAQAWERQEKWLPLQ